jgi:hypothetical protein
LVLLKRLAVHHHDIESVEIAEPVATLRRSRASGSTEHEDATQTAASSGDGSKRVSC